MTDATTPTARFRPVRVLGIAGSLRHGSYNKMLLRAATELAPQGMELTTFERLADIPLYNADLDVGDGPEPVRALRAALAGADALLIATPEYNYGVPGVLKNVIDWASRPPATSPLCGMPAGLMGASAGTSGTMRAQLALRQSFVFTQTYALQAPEVLVARAAEKFDATGRLVDEKTRDVLRTYLAALVAWTRKLHG
jgi:chromate reductase, NAD(P)H dehydrogenase (quinone)